MTENDLKLRSEEADNLSQDIDDTFNLGMTLQTNPENRNVFRARLSRIDGVFDRFCTNVAEAKRLSLILQQNEVYDSLIMKNNMARTLYYKTIALDESMLPQNKNNSSIFMSTSGAAFKLPNLDIPKFKGEFSKWVSFQDTFTSLVDSNPDLNDVQKFHYLKLSLQGPALQTISSIPITEHNYAQAWAAVKKKYSNKRIQATQYLTKIFGFKPVTKASLQNLETFSSEVMESISAFRKLQLPDEGGFILTTFVLRLLDPRSRDKFESQQIGKEELPELKSLETFLHHQWALLQTESLSSLIDNACTPNKTPGSQIKHNKQVFLSTDSANNNNTGDLCPLCKSNHRLYRCSRFMEMNPKQRLDLVQTQKMCACCLSPRHTLKDCKSRYRCSVTQCQKQHNTLLHLSYKYELNKKRMSVKPKSGDQPSVLPKQQAKVASPNMQNSSGDVDQSTYTQEDSKVYTVSSNPTKEKNLVLLGTAEVNIEDRFGNPHKIRIIIDGGAQRSFITTSCAQQLGLKFKKNYQQLCGFSDTPIPGGKYQVQCTLSPRQGTQPSLQTNAVVIDKITSETPASYISEDIQTFLSDQPLADPLFWKPGDIHFLLGADIFADIFNGETLKTPEGYPNGLRTIFGLVLTGKLVTQPDYQHHASTLMIAAAPIDDLIKKFWEIEECSLERSPDLDDTHCEAHFLSTHSRDESGRYIVRLPFKQPENLLYGESRTLAMNRFKQLEFRLNKNASLKISYSEVLKEYLEQKYISRSDEIGEYYLPHHCVVKANSSTQVRIVFDASMPTSKGSLNSKLHAGPKLQPDIRNIILNFRKYAIVFTTDISQMFLQIIIHPEERKYLHFLYRFEVTDSVKDYVFNRVIFGLTPSPYLALRVIKQLVLDDGKTFPEASLALQEEIYIDDILSGRNTIKQTTQLIDELIALLRKGGFSLKKWSSNSKQILDHLGSEYIRDEPFSFSNLSDQYIKILGMQWDPINDVFSYKINPPALILSKRAILSTIARIYDPLGLLAPVVFKAKCILQKLWSLNLDWDSKLPESIAQEWIEYYNQLPLLSSIQIQRYVLSTDNPVCTVIGFADASSLGYAAAVYLRTVNGNGEVKVELIASKTKLAPLKTISIPRLELGAALLLTRTLNALQPFLSTLPLNETYLLSDSTVVLGWLRLSPHTLKIFVANRITEILQKTSTKDWYHVSTHDNAADPPSRGLQPSALVDHSLWWHGPHWLKDSPSKWPIKNPYSTSDLPELKPINVLLSTPETYSYLIEVMERYSQLQKLQRIIAYMLRLINTSSKKTTNHGDKSTLLWIYELQQANTICIKVVQRHYFANEISLIEKNQPSNKLQSLSPFIDSLGILRVGGRLTHSPLKFETRHPIILPSKSHFTNLVIDYYHISYLHAGPQLLHSLLQRSYWIVAGRRVIRSRIHQCLKCHRLRVSNITPYMSSLPPSRFEQGQPFINVGIDFAGPFLIKDSNRRKAVIIKAYVCVFICMSTKACHLELVSNMTTDAFLACLDRFIARRGCPSSVFSDNGSNFIGAKRILKDLFNWFTSSDTQDKIRSHLTPKSIKWTFSPPFAPHFGGVWEAGVKSFKTHLVRVLDERPLTFEELLTVIVRIEAVLNSRPLYPRSSAPEEYDVLTPGHFLVGSALVAPPESDLIDTATNRLSRWQLLNKSVQHIWNRWRLEYLNSLQQRAKWKILIPNLKPNTLVLIKEPNTPPLSWPTGRVLETYPGKDGQVRVVKLKTPKGEYIRSVNQLAPLLPLSDE